MRGVGGAAFCSRTQTLQHTGVGVGLRHEDMSSSRTAGTKNTLVPAELPTGTFSAKGGAKKFLWRRNRLRSEVSVCGEVGHLGQLAMATRTTSTETCFDFRTSSRKLSPQ